jgi:LPS sulfotransferase NodH
MADKVNVQFKLDVETYKEMKRRLIDIEMSWQQWCLDQVITELTKAYESKKTQPKKK